MPKQNITKNVHKQRLKLIRKYVNFDYDLRAPLKAHQKRKIKKYYDEVVKLTARPHHVYVPRRKDRLKKAQEFAQHQGNLSGFKVAFIPTAGHKVPKIRFSKNGDLYTESDHVRTRFIPFDKRRIIEDTYAYVEELVKKKGKGLKQFSILSGEFEIPHSFGPTVVAKYVTTYAMAYSDQDKNSYFGNWMIGLKGHSFKNQESHTDMQREKHRAKMEMQTKRKNKKKNDKKRGK